MKQQTYGTEGQEGRLDLISSPQGPHAQEMFEEPLIVELESRDLENMTVLSDPKTKKKKDKEQSSSHFHVPTLWNLLRVIAAPKRHQASGENFQRNATLGDATAPAVSRLFSFRGTLRVPAVFWLSRGCFYELGVLF